MRVRLLTALAGVVAAGALSARAQEPGDPSLFPLFDSAGQHIIRGAFTANVVPAPFRSQLVVDNRFPPRPDPAKKDPTKKLEPTPPEDLRDPRDRTGKMHCMICEHRLDPMIAIFVRTDPGTLKGDDGLAQLLRRLDQKNDDPQTKETRPRKGLLPLRQADKLGAFVVFLRLDGGEKAVVVKDEKGNDQKVAIDLEYPHDEARAVKVGAVRKYFDAVRCDLIPFGLAPTKSRAAAAFALDENVPVTIVLYNRLRVARRWEFTLTPMPGDKPDLVPLTDERAAEIVTAVEELIRSQRN